MTDVICIGAQNPLDVIVPKLEKELAFLAVDGVQVKTRTGRSRFFNFLFCEIEYGEAAYSLPERRHLSRQCIANALTDVIVDDWQQDTLRRVLGRRFHCFQDAEKEKIVELASAKLLQKDAGPNSKLYRVARKSRVRESLSSYLSNKNEINLDGFLHFRLRSYWEELEDVIYLSIDQYLNEKEYREFIQLLRYFVEIMEPRHDLVHVILCGRDGFAILDQQGHILQADALTNEFKLQSGYADQDDLLISGLLSVAPREIILHVGTFQEHLQLMEMLRQVFSPRIKFCRSCDYCVQSAVIEPQEN